MSGSVTLIFLLVLYNNDINTQQLFSIHYSITSASVTLIFYWHCTPPALTFKVNGMNECLTTPQHENQIGYWVSEKGKCMKWLYNSKLKNIKHSVKSCAINTSYHRLIHLKFRIKFRIS